MSYAEVWLNGKFVGGWPYGYASWRVDLTPFVKFGGENVVAIPQVRAEQFLVIAKAKTSFPGQKKSGHGFDGEVMMALLENRTNIDHRVDVRARGGVFPHR